MGQLLSTSDLNNATAVANTSTPGPLDGFANVPGGPGELSTYATAITTTGDSHSGAGHSTDLSQQAPGVFTNSSSLNGTRTDFTQDNEFSVNVYGTVLYPLRWISLSSLASWLGPLSSLAMIIGCVLPYVPQYITIYKEQSCSGFSTYVCLTLLIANILRIAFWFGHRFELPLLIQSVIMIFTQILLLELCVRIKRQNAPNSSMRRNLLTCNPKHFWRWTDLASHLAFLIIFTTLLGCAVYYFIDNQPFIESLGYCALVTESMLGVPQVIRNYRKRSVAGMSLSMVVMWLAGDTFKTGYFIFNAVPYQFWLCGALQMTIDIVILFQVCLFKQNAPIKMRSLWVR